MKENKKRFDIADQRYAMRYAVFGELCEELELCLVVQENWDEYFLQYAKVQEKRENH